MDEEDTFDEGLFRYTVDSSTLKTLASQELAKMSYRYAIREQYAQTKHVTVLSWPWGHKLRILEKFNIDEEFVYKIIDSYRIFYVTVWINSWIEFHQKHVYFDSNEKVDILNCLEDLAFNHNGSISYSKTAKNLLIGDKLNVIEKYRFACLNCLIDDVKTLWPLVSNDPRVGAHSGNLNPLIDYWTRSMEGEFPQLFGSDADAIERRQLILDLGAWPGIEYIFDKETVEERMESALYLLEFCTGSVTELSNVFLKFNDDQNMFEEVMKNITISNVFLELRFSGHLLYEVWNVMRHFVSGDQFCMLIYLFLLDEKFHEAFTSYNSYFFAFKMWISAPYRLKHHVIEVIKEVENIFKDYAEFYDEERVLKSRDIDMRFFLALLADLRFEFRNSLWCKYWTKLLIMDGLAFLDRAMKLCFRTEREIIRFKETEMMNFANIENFCLQVIMFGSMQYLDDYLNFCSTNVDRVRAVKREIAESPKIQSKFLNSWIDQQGVIAFDKFIDGAFISRDDARNYKITLMTSSIKLRSVLDGVDEKLLGVPWV